MTLSLRSLTRAAVTFFAAATVAACGSDGPTEGPTLAGAYQATTFRVTPTGQSTIDALSQGGALSIVIAANNTTTGTLTLPASVTGAAPLTASMAGTAVRTGGNVDFAQSADSFVRDLTWTLGTNTLSVTDQTVGGARFTIVLTRQ